MTQYFNYSEFECSCGKNETERALIDQLNFARETAEVPFVINSGFRCEKHNADAGGKPDSSHLTGLAADIKCKSSRPRYKILSGLLEAGFTRIGIHKTFIHADIDESKPEEVVWMYS